MSRLDDELRKAFRREQPSGDFAARLLQRVAQQPAPKPRWWQRLATRLDPPKLRWVAIGVTASLLLAIGAAQYSRLKHVVVNDNGTIAQTEPPPDASEKAAVNPGGDVSARNSVSLKAPPSVKHAAASSPNHRLAVARHAEERELKAEGEAAKEQLMLALSIASTALNDAQKAVHDDGLNP